MVNSNLNPFRAAKFSKFHTKFTTLSKITSQLWIDKINNSSCSKEGENENKTSRLTYEYDTYASHDRFEGYSGVTNGTFSAWRLLNYCDVSALYDVNVNGIDDQVGCARATRSKRLKCASAEYINRSRTSDFQCFHILYKSIKHRKIDLQIFRCSGLVSTNSCRENY